MSEDIKLVQNYKTELEKNKVIAFVPKGNSMWPNLKNNGQSVVVGAKTASRLAVYDVAFYQRQNGALVLHRVMEVKEGGYVMCGDSQFNREWVEEGAVFGKMLGFYHKQKYIEARDPKQVKRVEKWFKRKTLRKIRLKLFYLRLRVKNKLKRAFSKKDGE